MKQFEKLNRRLLCRDGPRLEMSNSTQTGLCGNQTAMATSSSSIVRFFPNVSAETAGLAIAAKPERFSGNAKNDCSTASTAHQTVQSVHRMLCRKRFDRQRPRPVSMNPADRHGRNAMTGISNIRMPEGENDLSMIRHRVLASPKQFLRDIFPTTTCLEEC